MIARRLADVAAVDGDDVVPAPDLRGFTVR